MEIKSLAVTVQYRITVPKDDKRRDILKQFGNATSYWIESYNADENDKKFIEWQENMISKNIRDLEDVPVAMKLVEQLKGSEAVQVKVQVGLESNVDEDGRVSFFNGKHRLNSSFEYFHDYNYK